MDHYVNTVVIDMYMKDQASQFCIRLQDFHHFASLFFFLIKPESSKDLKLSEFEWIDIEDFQMLLIDFKASLLLTSKFVN